MWNVDRDAFNVLSLCSGAADMTRALDMALAALVVLVLSRCAVWLGPTSPWGAAAVLTVAWAVAWMLARE